MARMKTEACCTDLTSGRDQRVDFRLATVLRRGVRIGAGVQLDGVDTEFGTRGKLDRIRIKKQTHEDAGIFESANRLGDAHAAPDHIEATFSRHFLAPLWHKRGLERMSVASDGQHVFGTSQLQVDRHRHRFDEYAQVTFLNMAAVFAEMDGDRIGTAELSESGCPNGIGLIRLASLTYGGDVVDVDA
jgi:hypothetical protein